MNEYTASNGVTVSYEEGELTVDSPRDYDYIQAPHIQALREFFQHERDEELGRWRWPENPEYVVYASDQFAVGALGSWVRVVHEVTSFAEEFARHTTVGETRAGMLFPAAAQAFFEAHPDRKPWDDAKPGELWELTRKGFGTHVWRRGKYEWRIVAPGTTGSVSPVDAIEVDSGHRIWPEADES